MASCRYCNDRKRHVRVYLSENWMDLDETWLENGECRKSGPVKFSVRSLQSAGENGKILTFICDKYHASFWSFLLYRFHETWQEYANRVRRNRLREIPKSFLTGFTFPKNRFWVPISVVSVNLTFWGNLTSSVT